MRCHAVADSLTPAAVAQLPDAIREPIIESYNEALLPIFLFMVPLIIVAFFFLLFVEEKPLATRIDTQKAVKKVIEEAEPEVAEQTELITTTSTEPTATREAGS